MSGTSQFYFKTTEDEQIETTIHIHPESKCAIIGKVKYQDDSPVADATVLLYEGQDASRLLSRAFTNSDGTFCFGPLQPDKLHNIKIYKDTIKIRELEIKAEV